jgi:hypothetical protein
MANRKKITEPLVPFVPPAPSGPPARDGWGICPGTGCMQERRTEYGELVAHRRWHTWDQHMVPCDGSGREPPKVTT